MWAEIRYRATQGDSERAIARALGVSRNTVKKALAQEEPPHYQRAGGAERELDRHRALVEAGLRRRLRGVRLLAQVRDAGYQGSDSAFYRWLAEIRGTERTGNPACRFETDPGEQSQFDWAEYQVLLGGVLTDVFVFSLVLGYSRRARFHPSLSKDKDAIFDALISGFIHFGGCCRELVVDNPRAMVLQHRRGESAVWNDDFFRLCGHYRIRPIACTVANPRAKGKCEKPFDHFQTWVIDGNKWPDFEAFDRHVAAFETWREQRVHGTTKVPPIERFEEERGLLIPLPGNPHATLSHSLREVSNDGLFSYGGVPYNVPSEYSGGKVVVSVSQGRYVVVRDLAGKEIARHLKHPKGSPPVINPAYYEGLRGRQRACFATLAGRYRERFGGAGEAAEVFLQQLLARHPHHPERAIESVLELLVGIPEEIAVAALAEAVEFGLCEPAFVQEALRRRLCGGRHRCPAPPPPTQLNLPELEVERPLSAYGRALPEETPEQNRP